MFRLTRSFSALGTTKSSSLFRAITTQSTEQHEPSQGQNIIEEENINEENLDQFTKEFLRNQIKVTAFQRILLTAGSSIAALLDPRRHDMIACLGETTGEEALQKILQVMQASTEGQDILKEKPRINTKTVNLEELKNMSPDTFGHHYYKFLDDNKVTPDSRLEVRFMEDPLLAYVMTRYRETHDLVHTILGMPTNMLGEVAVKWVEAINIGLPMCYGGAVFGAMRLRPKQREAYKRYYLPWAVRTGREMKPLLPIFWEKRWTQNINDLRQELNIKTLEIPKK